MNGTFYKMQRSAVKQALVILGGGLSPKSDREQIVEQLMGFLRCANHLLTPLAIYPEEDLDLIWKTALNLRYKI